MKPSFQSTPSSPASIRVRRTAVLVAAATLAAFSFVACNTVDGAGKDIEKGGEAIQKAAN